MEKILLVVDEAEDDRRLVPVSLSPAASLVFMNILKEWMESGLAWRNEKPSPSAPPQD